MSIKLTQFSSIKKYKMKYIAMYSKEHIYKTRLQFFFCTVLIGLLLSSCERELDENNDFTTNVPVEVFGDNELLFSKIFRFQDTGNYLWFDIRNEIANFSNPYFGIDYKKDGVDRFRRIDFRGRLYEYQSKNETLTVLDYPLNILTGEDESTNLVFDFSRREKDGCDNIIDTEIRNQCERTFVLTLKQMVFNDLDLVVPVETTVSYEDTTLSFSNVSQEIYLTN